MFVYYFCGQNKNRLTMKTKIKLCLLLLCVFIISLLYIHFLDTVNNKSTSLVLMNIEALASGEENTTMCVGFGSVDCPRSYQKMLYIVER